MKIAVVFTGDAIGERLNVGIIDAAFGARYALLERLDPEIQIKTFEPYTADGADVTGKHWNKLLKCVGRLTDQDFDGIIVALGTDSLPYTAAALGYAFAGTDKPVLLIGADRPLSDPATNAFVNLYAAVECVRQNVAGVFVVYRNSDGAQYIHNAMRLLPQFPFSSDLYSVGGSVYGMLTDDGLQLNPAYASGGSGENIGEISFDKCNEKVLCVSAQPGGVYVKISRDTKAILYTGFSVGALPAENDKLFKKAESKDVPVFLAGVDSDAVEKNAAKLELQRVTVLPKLSPAAALVKLRIIAENDLPWMTAQKDFGDIIA